MDTPLTATQIIILTSIVNVIISGLVGGVVIYVIQKKIDATIQKSLFEHQTKFARSHEKTVETLEILHQKYSLFARMCNVMIGEKDAGRKTAVFDQLIDFWGYFLENRMYIAENVEDDMQEIFMNSSVVVGNSIKAFDDPDSGKFLIECLHELQKQIRTLENLYKSVAKPQ